MKKLSESLVKVNESVTFNRYDNGYVIEIGGRDKEDEWVTRKIVCNTLDEVIDLVKQYAALPLND